MPLGFVTQTIEEFLKLEKHLYWLNTRGRVDDKL